MMGRKKSSKIKHFLLCLISFLIVFAGTFIGVQFFTKTGLFRIPGVVTYDESLLDDEKTLLSEIFTEEIDLDKDVKISASESFEYPELTSGQFLYDIIVPVVDFYSSETNVTAENPGSLKTNCTECPYQLVSVDKLDNKSKLISINDHYYLDEFTSGAIFRTITFESEKFDEEIAPLIGDKLAKSFPSKDTVLTFAQTGVTALSRGMNRKLYSVGNGSYFAENIKDYLSSFDITHTSNESSFTNYASASNICSDPRFIDTLLAIGLDVVELTGNHNQDCGVQAALDTIDTYNEKGIKIVGGGKNATEAAKPLNLSGKGTNITFLAYNQSTGGATYGERPGANQYYEENAAKEITAAKERGDFVVVDIQYYECNAYANEIEDSDCDYANSSAGDQITFFRHLIDLGADVVVGTSAHQTQTFEKYGNGVIYYGLGNLFFDQVWWPGTTRSLILSHYFYNGKLLQTKLVPTIYDNNMQTRLLDADTTKWFIERLVKARP